MMTPERWKQLKPLLETALELDPSARAEYVASVARDEASVGDELQALLDGSERAGFLDEWHGGRPPSSPEHLPATASSRSGAVDELYLGALLPYTTLVVSTRHRRYEMVLVSPVTLEAVVTGGRHWPEPTTAFATRDTIRVGERLALRDGAKRILTSRVTQIHIQDKGGLAP